MTWVVIGLVLSVASGAIFVPYLVLFKPWRVKRLAYFLMAHWPWYRSWVFRLIARRMKRAMQEATATMGRALRPVMEKTAAAMRAWNTAMQEAGIGG